MRPHDLPTPAEFLARLPHGVRARYIAGCKCMLCRAANSRYQTQRKTKQAQGRWNGLVPAAPARRHIRSLGRRGMGYRQVVKASGVARIIVQGISSGRQTQCRAETAKRILAVQLQLGGAQKVPAGPTWARLDQLLREGFTKKRLAVLLGSRSKTPSLQVQPDFVLVATARKVARLHAHFMR